MMVVGLDAEGRVKLPHRVITPPYIAADVGENRVDIGNPHAAVELTNGPFLVA